MIWDFYSFTPETIFLHPLTTFVAADSVNGTNYPDLPLNSSGISMTALDWQEGGKRDILSIHTHATLTGRLRTFGYLSIILSVFSATKRK
jgi:hypothetical protein